MTTSFYTIAFLAEQTLDPSTFKIAKRRGVDALVVDMPTSGYDELLVDHLAVSHPQPALALRLSNPGDDWPVDTLKSLGREMQDVRYARAFKRPVVVLNDPAAWTSRDFLIEQLRNNFAEELLIVGTPQSTFEFDTAVAVTDFQQSVKEFAQRNISNEAANILFVREWTPASRAHLDAFMLGVVSAAGGLPSVEGDAFAEHLNRYAPYSGAGT